MTSVLPQLETDNALIAPEFITLPVATVLGGSRRLEASSYLSDGFNVRQRIRHSADRFTLLGELAKVQQPSRLKAILVQPEHGVPVVTATQAFDMWPTPRKWLAPGKTPDLADRYV